MVKRIVLDPERVTGSKLNLALIREFCKHVKLGRSFDAVCDYLEIDYASLWRWMKRGNAYIAAGETPKKDYIYGHFVKQLRRAHAKYLFRLTDGLHRENNEEWRRELAILERRDRKNFSKQDQAGGSPEEYEPDERYL